MLKYCNSGMRAKQSELLTTTHGKRSQHSRTPHYFLSSKQK
jgi:hypothetical protein